MELEAVAKALKELGHPTRLFIFKHLVKARGGGVSQGAGCQAEYTQGERNFHAVESLGPDRGGHYFQQGLR